MAEWAYNPITGNLDRVGEGGSGGNITISGDSGDPITGDDFSIVGQEANGVPVMDVDTSTGDVAIANNTWQTQYVVDPSDVLGLRGTFQTWQAAIDKAVSDGSTFDNGICHTIFIRPGTYNESIVIPENANLNFLTDVPSGIPESPGYYQNLSVILNGNVTFEATGQINSSFENIYFSSDSGNTIDISSDSVKYFSLKNCYVNATSPGMSLSVIDNTSAFIIAIGCVFGAKVTNSSGSTPLSGLPRFLNCIFNDTFTFENGATAIIKNSSLYDIVANDNSSFQIYNCNFNTSISWITGTTTQEISVINCSGLGQYQLTSYPLIDTSGIVRYCDISYQVMDPTNPSDQIYGENVIPVPWVSTCGTILNSIETDSNYVMQPYETYVGVTDTSSSVTITLPTNPIPDAFYMIKDESMGAGTNSITVSGTIDGVTDYEIDVNGGFLIVKADLSGNFYIIGDNESAPFSPQQWVNVPGTSQAMTIWQKYVANNASQVEFTLPTSAPFGTEIEVMGNGAGGWIINQSSGQTINYGIISTTTGVSGSLSSDDDKDSVRLVCVEEDLTWNVASSQGNLNVI